jgi:hypothetical protein
MGSPCQLCSSDARGVRPHSRMGHTALLYEITEDEAGSGGSVDRVAVPGRPASMVDGSRGNPVRRPVACRYVAAVPELSAGLPRIPGLPGRCCLIARSWPSWPQRAGCHAGWATGRWRCGPPREPSPRGYARLTPRIRHSWTCAARAPATGGCRGSSWAAGLEGGGSVVVLEFVPPVDHPVHGQFAGQWRARAGDAEFQEVRRAAQMIDAEYIAGRTAPPRSSPSERPGPALPDDHARVCQGTAADAPSRSRTPDLPPQSAHILAEETCAISAGTRAVPAGLTGDDL